MKKSGTQIPSLRPLSTLRPCRIRDGIRSSVTTAWPSAASVQASMIESTSASTRLTPGSTTDADERAGGDRERQADPEQARRYSELAAQGGERDPRSVGEEDQRQRRLRQQLDGLAADVQVDQPEHRTCQQARGREEDRRGHDRPLEPTRHGREREQHNRDRGDVPGSQLLTSSSSQADGVERRHSSARSLPLRRTAETSAMTPSVPTTSRPAIRCARALG